MARQPKFSPADEARLRVDWLSSLSNDELAARFGVTVNILTYRGAALGLPPRHHSNHRPAPVSLPRVSILEKPEAP